MITMSFMEHIAHSKLIDKIGGTVAAARVFEVSPQAVSKWRRDGIPRARLMYIKAIRPDLFDDNQHKAAA